MSLDLRPLSVVWISCANSCRPIWISTHMRCRGTNRHVRNCHAKSSKQADISIDDMTICSVLYGLNTPTAAPLKVPRVKREHKVVVVGTKLVAAIRKVAMVVGIFVKIMVVAVGVHEVAATARARTLVGGKVAVQAPIAMVMVMVMVGGGEQSNHDGSIAGMVIITIGSYLHEPNFSHQN